MNETEQYYRKKVVSLVLTVSFIIFLIYILFSSLLIYFFSESLEEINPWLLVINEIAFIFLPSILAVKFLRIDWQEIFRLNLPSMKIILVSVGGIFFLQMFSDGFVSLQEYLLPESWKFTYAQMLNDYIRTMSSLIGSNDLSLLLRGILIIAIVPAISEEFLFRGFLQTSLEYSTKILYAIIISSFLFAAMHFNPIFFIPLAVAGAYFGFASYFTSSIILPIILHFVTNTVSVFNIYFSGSEVITTDNTSLVLSLIFVVGGLAGLILTSTFLYRESLKTKSDLQEINSNDV